ncbi:hypothetical protein KIPB_001484 [Kipferlia bialata]|uniref:Helicase-associated domain-containing protein n=1 Tax=Kipferlia bialata TaxID=797122 RepID=A0A9K3GF82_9EUKA|nr:hypothetical protein KIPB_001484 [Kipferlia bialata]|eukprot:g1484.t1
MEQQMQSQIKELEAELADIGTFSDGSVSPRPPDSKRAASASGSEWEEDESASQESAACDYASDESDSEDSASEYDAVDGSRSQCIKRRSEMALGNKRLTKPLPGSFLEKRERFRRERESKERAKGKRDEMLLEKRERERVDREREDVTWKKSFQDVSRFLDSNQRWPNEDGKSGESDLHEWCGEQCRKRTAKRKPERLSETHVQQLDSIEFPWELWTHGTWPSEEESPLLYAWVDAQRYIKVLGMAKERTDLLDSLGYKWFPRSENWDAAFSLLKEYLTENETWPTASEGPLGTWVNRQRNARRDGHLPQDRVSALEGVGIEWEATAKKASWGERLRELEEHLAVHSTWPTASDDPTLAAWIYTQRSLKRAGKLDKDRVASLEKITIVWEPLAWRLEKGVGECQPPRSKAAFLDQRLVELGDYIRVNGTWPERKTRLGDWVSHQRTLRKKGELRKEVETGLEKLGIDWDRKLTQLATRWNGRLEELKKHLADIGKWPTAGDNEALHSWVLRQRKLRRKGKMAPERIRALDSLGMDWEGRSGTLTARWQCRLADLKGFLGAHKRWPVAKDDASLTKWVTNQRCLRRKVAGITDISGHVVPTRAVPIVWSGEMGVPKIEPGAESVAGERR